MVALVSTGAQASARPKRGETLSVLIAASVTLTLSMGMRSSLGLFMLPMTRDLGITISDFTFAIAIQNLAWGLTQPFVGAYADKFGCRPVMLGGALCYVLGLVATIFATGWITLTLGTGLLMGFALACTAANLGLTATARIVTPASRSMMLGLISAFGSVGSFVCAPLAQGLISTQGWQIALVAFVVLASVMIPAAFLTGIADRYQEAASQDDDGPATVRGTLRVAARHRGYVTMVGAVFVCGLQLFFLTAHLPTYLSLCGQDPMLSAEALGTIGLFNIAGCYILGWLGGRFPKHILLGFVYVFRSIALAVYFLLPATQESTLIFAAVMGLLWLGILPLTQGLIAEMFGLRYLATLSGVSFFNHQIGSFLGIWGGGLIFDALGSYDLAWQIGVAIGLIAGFAQMTAGSDARPNRGVLQPVPA
jgi:predicted MFS family arabinose efflux permease